MNPPRPASLPETGIEKYAYGKTILLTGVHFDFWGENDTAR